MVYYIFLVSSALREEPSQISVILPAAKLTAVCTVYEQWLAISGCNYGLKTAVKTHILFHISAITLTVFK